MSNETKVVQKNGLGLSGTLTVLFVLLKVFKVVTWSWWLVFLPVIISTGLVLIFLSLALLFAILAAVLGK